MTRLIGKTRSALIAFLLLASSVVGGCAPGGEGPAMPDLVPLPTENGLAHDLAVPMFGPAIFPAPVEQNSRAINSAIQRALETAPDGVRRQWTSTDGYVRWAVTAADTSLTPHGICRSFMNTALVQGQEYRSKARACRKVNGVWFLQP